MKLRKLQILAFVVIGVIAFGTTANLDINPYFKFYLTLSEIQVGVFLVIYFMGRVTKKLN
jgi:uncharacterized membrane protein